MCAAVCRALGRVMPLGDSIALPKLAPLQTGPDGAPFVLPTCWRSIDFPHFSLFAKRRKKILCACDVTGALVFVCALCTSKRKIFLFCCARERAGGRAERGQGAVTGDTQQTKRNKQTNNRIEFKRFCVADEPKCVARDKDKSLL